MVPVYQTTITSPELLLDNTYSILYFHSKYISDTQSYTKKQMNLFRTFHGALRTIVFFCMLLYFCHLVV